MVFITLMLCMKTSTRVTKAILCLVKQLALASNYASPTSVNLMDSFIFCQYLGDPDIWMRDKGGNHEYIAVYVNDLLYAGKNSRNTYISSTFVLNLESLIYHIRHIINNDTNNSCSKKAARVL